MTRTISVGYRDSIASSVPFFFSPLSFRLIPTHSFHPVTSPVPSRSDRGTGLRSVECVSRVSATVDRGNYRHIVGSLRILPERSRSNSNSVSTFSISLKINVSSKRTERDSKGYHPFERMNRFSRFKSICDATKRPRFVEILLLACSRGQNMRNRRGRWSVDTRCSRCSAWSLMPVPMRDVLINVRRSDFFIATARFRCIKPVGYFILVALIHLRSRGDVPCK